MSSLEKITPMPEAPGACGEQPGHIGVGMFMHGGEAQGFRGDLPAPGAA